MSDCVSQEEGKKLVQSCLCLWACLRGCGCERWAAAGLVHATKIRLAPLADISPETVCVCMSVGGWWPQPPAVQPLLWRSKWNLCWNATRIRESLVCIVSVCLCVCVCVWERENERRGRQREICWGWLHWDILNAIQIVSFSAAHDPHIQNMRRWSMLRY